jgi:hypothetical protein
MQVRFLANAFFAKFVQLCVFGGCASEVECFCYSWTLAFMVAAGVLGRTRGAASFQERSGTLLPRCVLLYLLY